MYLNPVVSLYEGESTDADVAAAQAALQKTAADAAAAAAQQQDKVFTQEQLNQYVQERLAKDRKARQEEFKKIEKDYQNLLASKGLTESERDSLTERLEELQRQNRTKEEQAKVEKREIREQYENKLKELEKRAQDYENRYTRSTIERALTDAASKHGAYKASQIVTILEKHTKLVPPVDEKGNPIDGELVPRVDLPDVNEAGEAYISNRTPDDAVERLKVIDPNLFLANVAAGVGGASTTGGVTPGANGEIDISKLTPEQYQELRRKDPAKVGRARRAFQ